MHVDSVGAKGGKGAKEWMPEDAPEELWDGRGGGGVQALLTITVCLSDFQPPWEKWPGSCLHLQKPAPLNQNVSYPPALSSSLPPQLLADQGPVGLS